MNNVLPEHRKGDVIIRLRNNSISNILTVRKVGQGEEFDEPVYYLAGKYGTKLKKSYTGEELASLGYTLLENNDNAKHHAKEEKC